MVKHQCGYCGTTESWLIAHGVKLQPAWYKDEKYGYLCKNCYARKNRTGHIEQDSIRRENTENQYKERADVLLKGKWKCIAVSLSRDFQTDGIKVNYYTLQCTSCGKKIRWHKSIALFLKSKEFVCDCVAFRWVMDSGMILKRADRAKEIAETIIREGSAAKARKVTGLTRQRINQVRMQMRNAYFMLNKEAGNYDD